MKVLIVHAHFEEKSFSAAMCQSAIDTLESNGHEVKVSDLYKMNFNPVASPSDFIALKREDYFVYALEQRNAYECGLLCEEIKSEFEKLMWCDLLIFNFPLFWCSYPAILKGWIDRVLLSGPVYGGRRFYNCGGLVGKKALAAVTLGAPEKMFGINGIHGEFNTLLRPLLRGTFAYVGMEVLEPFRAHFIPYLTDEKRSAILTKYSKYISNIENLSKLNMPILEDYDESYQKNKELNDE